jgi:hypothetical protein
MHPKSSIENSAQLWLPEMVEGSDAPGESEVPAESPRWCSAAFRFRLIGIADMRGDSSSAEQPSPSRPTIPDHFQGFEQHHET